MTIANSAPAAIAVVANDKLRPVHRAPYGRKVADQTLGQMSVLADHMADGCPSISEAARRMGLTQSRADQLWQRIRRGLGERAR